MNKITSTQISNNQLFCASIATDTGMGDTGGLNSQRVNDYLLANSSFLEDHILENVDIETIERWLIRRTRKERANRSSFRSINSEHLLSPGPDRKVSLSRWKVIVYSIVIQF